MKVSKAVIPAAGLGTRFLPATKAQPKEMLPVLDKPVIQYVVEEAVRAGIHDVLIVTGRGKRTIEDHFDRSFELEYYLHQKGKHDLLEELRSVGEGAAIHYIRQRDPLGLGNAVAVAEPHMGGAPFAVLLGDDLLDPAVGLLRDMLAAHERTGASVLAAMHVGAREIAMYGCIGPGEPDGDLVRVSSIVEKPDPADAPSDLAVIGRYVLTPAIFEALRRTAPGAGGEIQLTDAIALLAADEPVFALSFARGRFDVGNPLDAMKAQVELALAREDIGPAFRAWLEALLA